MNTTRNQLARIMERKPWASDSDNYEVVLVHYHNPVTPYVTWIRRNGSETEQNPLGERFWGHYHPTLTEATLDFEGR